MLEATGALRDQERFEHFLIACEADSRGRLGFEDRSYPQADYLRRARSVALSVTAQGLRERGLEGEQGLEGKALGDAILAERVRLLNQLREAP
jgi:tRNA nucleotidyltransferase (CCA-adding enzyme)